MPLDIDVLVRLQVEPLDRDRHDRASFTCGEPRIDTYLKTRAAGLMDVEGTRVWVARFESSSEIVAFYAMNAHAIDAIAVPKNLQRKLPRDHPIGAVFLSNIGTARAYQGKGVGSFMISDAFRRAVTAADAIGAAFIVLDTLNENAARLYHRAGFIPLPEPKGRMLIPMKQVRAALAEDLT